MAHADDDLHEVTLTVRLRIAPDAQPKHVADDVLDWLMAITLGEVGDPDRDFPAAMFPANETIARTSNADVAEVRPTFCAVTLTDGDTTYEAKWEGE